MAKSNQNFVQDIINQRRELEKEPPTLDELTEKAATAYKEKNGKKLPTIHPKDKEALSALLKKIINETNSLYPEKDETFLSHIPEMHLSWSAIAAINRSSSLSKIYAMVMTKIYDNQIPFEIEKIILALDEPELIKQLHAAGHKWSSRAQTIMSKLHPQTHRLISIKEVQFGSVIF